MPNAHDTEVFAALSEVIDATPASLSVANSRLRSLLERDWEAPSDPVLAAEQIRQILRKFPNCIFRSALLRALGNCHQPIALTPFLIYAVDTVDPVRNAARLGLCKLATLSTVNLEGIGPGEKQFIAARLFALSSEPEIGDVCKILLPLVDSEWETLRDAKRLLEVRNLLSRASIDLIHSDVDPRGVAAKLMVALDSVDPKWQVSTAWKDKVSEILLSSLIWDRPGRVAERHLRFLSALGWHSDSLVDQELYDFGTRRDGLPGRLIELLDTRQLAQLLHIWQHSFLDTEISEDDLAVQHLNDWVMSITQEIAERVSDLNDESLAIAMTFSVPKIYTRRVASAGGSDDGGYWAPTYEEVPRADFTRQIQMVRDAARAESQRRLSQST